MKHRIYLDPNDSFYREGANEWLVKLMNMVGDEQARSMVADIEGTWREVRDAIRVLVETTPHPVSFTEPVDEAEQQEQEVASYEFLLGSATMQADLELDRLLAPEIARRDLADSHKRMVTLPPVVSWNEAMTELERDFNRRYYGNSDGKPEWRK